MEFAIRGLGVTEVFAAALFAAFALFAFLAVLFNTKFSIDRLGKAFRLGLRPKALVVSMLSLLAGGAWFLLMVVVGGLIGTAALSAVPVVIFTVIGAAGLVYVLFASAYFLNYLAIAGLRDDVKATFGEAFKAFLANQGQIMLLPAVIGGIILAEQGIFALIGLAGKREAGFFLSALFQVPLLPLNLVLFTLLFLGCGIFLPIMIDQKKNALATIGGVALAVKQQPLRLLAAQVIVLTFLGVSAGVMYLVFNAASSIGAAQGSSPLMMVAGELMKNPLAIFEMGGASAGVAIGVVLLTLLMLAVALLAAGFLWNLNMCLYAALYLGFIKESVNFNEKVFSGKGK